jgi:hypothetical protein
VRAALSGLVYGVWPGGRACYKIGRQVQKHDIGAKNSVIARWLLQAYYTCLTGLWEHFFQKPPLFVFCHSAFGATAYSVGYVSGLYRKKTHSFRAGEFRAQNNRKFIFFVQFVFIFWKIFFLLRKKIYIILL